MTATLTGEFIFVTTKNLARCPVCGEPVDGLWFYDDPALPAGTTRAVACAACLEKEQT